MNVLFFGDVVGHIGIYAIKNALPELKAKYQPDFIIANGENSVPDGIGISQIEFDMLRALGINAITLGNHWHGKVELSLFADEPELVRPANVLEFHKGSGSHVYDTKKGKIRVTNILGTAFMRETVSIPFISVNDAVNEGGCLMHIVDYHAESSSEKQTMAYAFDGRISALFGTHTHVLTNDAKILKGGTGFVNDLGYCGAYDAIIGYIPEVTLKKTIYGEKIPFQIAQEGETIVNGVFLQIDETTGKTTHIEVFSKKGRVEHGQDNI